MDWISLLAGALSWATAVLGGFGLGRRINRGGSLFLAISLALAAVTVVSE